MEFSLMSALLTGEPRLGSHARTRNTTRVRAFASRMHKLLLIAIGLCAFGALWKIEAEEDGADVAFAPFLAAVAIGVLLFGERQGKRVASRPFP
jgi:hypothetical protein